MSSSRWAFGADALRLFGTRTEQAADAAGLIGDRAVGPGEVGVFSVAVALHHEQDALVPRRLAALHDRLRLRTDDGPDLIPRLPRRATEGLRVTLAQNGDVRIVVNVDQL
jgi:hypothetical protein